MNATTLFTGDSFGSSTHAVVAPARELTFFSYFTLIVFMLTIACVVRPIKFKLPLPPCVVSLCTLLACAIHHTPPSPNDHCKWK